ncbi:DUF2909 family protein [Vibrio sagamiensis]|uniref:DUF2909 family protein n=1 Tax=Vibrio sagamiensis TaxID=512650 RepID=UPI000587E3F3|nr:DUF2909 family protein [Vibrio sagamiensis]PNQ66803.1 DUF2909 domain-containing protein [Vibrio agarivorans]
MSITFLFKTTLVLLLLFIIFNLAKALIEMVKDNPENSENRKPMSHYLGRRVMFSALVILLLLFALSAGWISPNPNPY